jgi:hypothetical protein
MCGLNATTCVTQGSAPKAPDKDARPSDACLQECYGSIKNIWEAASHEAGHTLVSQRST